jgi:hypothetical protein
MQSGKYVPTFQTILRYPLSLCVLIEAAGSPKYRYTPTGLYSFTAEQNSVHNDWANDIEPSSLFEWFTISSNRSVALHYICQF